MFGIFPIVNYIFYYVFRWTQTKECGAAIPHWYRR